MAVDPLADTTDGDDVGAPPEFEVTQVELPVELMQSVRLHCSTQCLAHQPGRKCIRNPWRRQGWASVSCGICDTVYNVLNITASRWQWWDGYYRALKMCSAVERKSVISYVFFNVWYKWTELTNLQLRYSPLFSLLNTPSIISIQNIISYMNYSVRYVIIGIVQLSHLARVTYCSLGSHRMRTDLVASVTSFWNAVSQGGSHSFSRAGSGWSLLSSPSLCCLSPSFWSLLFPLQHRLNIKATHKMERDISWRKLKKQSFTSDH